MVTQSRHFPGEAAYHAGREAAAAPAPPSSWRGAGCSDTPRAYRHIVLHGTLTVLGGLGKALAAPHHKAAAHAHQADLDVVDPGLAPCFYMPCQRVAPVMAGNRGPQEPAHFEPIP